MAVAVPVLTTDSLTWTCSSEKPARQTLLTRGIIPLLAEGSARSTDSDTTDEILDAAIEHAKIQGFCETGNSIIALHRIGAASVIKAVWIDGRELTCACLGAGSRTPLGAVSLGENLAMAAMGLWALARLV